MRQNGFTLIELVITVAIVAMLATAALPMAELTVQRSKEQDLRAALRQIRDGIDAYKKATVEGRVIISTTDTGYPKTLELLVDGVEDAKSAKHEKVYFLRRIPRDPFTTDTRASPSETWGKRSYKSSENEPQDGEDVYDVYSRATGKAINGTPYREW